METLTPPTLALLLTLTVTVTAAPTINAAISDCSKVYIKLSDCLEYVSEGSTIGKPAASCCSGLKEVLKTSSNCLCVGFQSKAQFDVEVDFTKAFGLPRACNLTTPSTNCVVAPAPLVAAPPYATEVNSPTPPTDYSGTEMATLVWTHEKYGGSAAISSISIFTSVFGIFVATFGRM